ncbi:MAG TPA: DUF2089 family protein [Vicinamibacterales bacterium]|nr:DUF2089 family protein [Vicinamibacterales bacterium]
MALDWEALTRLTSGSLFEIERVRLVNQDIAIEGRFTPPALAVLPAEDQVFVAAFVRSHGSIKQMEQLFGVSYPTVKNRLNRIAAALPFVDVEPSEADVESPITAILDRLERGELTGAQAIEELAPRGKRDRESPRASRASEPRERSGE